MDLKFFNVVNYFVDAETDVILVKIDGSFDRSNKGMINEAEVTMSFQMTASEVTFLPSDEPIKGVVSDQPSGFKIYEFYVNKMQFPQSGLF